MKTQLVCSLFSNRCVTRAGAEIKSHIFKSKNKNKNKDRKISKNQFITYLGPRGYSKKEITDELDRQCSYSVVQYDPLKDAYLCTDLGRHIWDDICNRVHDQPSMIAGMLQPHNTHLKINVYRSDFQSSQFKKKIKSVGLTRAPVMRWTGQFRRKEGLKILKTLGDMLPPSKKHQPADLDAVLQTIQHIIDTKSKKRAWAWMICHPVIQLKLTRSTEQVLQTLFSLSNGPVDWRGHLISLYELRINTDLDVGEIESSVEYLIQHGIIRKLRNDFTPTIEGYTLVRHALRAHPAISFALTHVTPGLYRLEISNPSYLNSSVRTLLINQGLSGTGTPLEISCNKEDFASMLNLVVQELGVL